MTSDRRDRETQVKCPKCEGRGECRVRGAAGRRWQKCDLCAGSGFVPVAVMTRWKTEHPS